LYLTYITRNLIFYNSVLGTSFETNHRVAPLSFLKKKWTNVVENIVLEASGVRSFVAIKEKNYRTLLEKNQLFCAKIIEI